MCDRSVVFGTSSFCFWTVCAPQSCPKQTGTQHVAAMRSGCTNFRILSLVFHKQTQLFSGSAGLASSVTGVLQDWQRSRDRRPSAFAIACQASQKKMRPPGTLSGANVRDGKWAFELSAVCQADKGNVGPGSFLHPRGSRYKYTQGQTSSFVRTADSSMPALASV